MENIYTIFLIEKFMELFGTEKELNPRLFYDNGLPVFKCNLFKFSSIYNLSNSLNKELFNEEREKVNERLKIFYEYVSEKEEGITITIKNYKDTMQEFFHLKVMFEFEKLLDTSELLVIHKKIMFPYYSDNIKNIDEWSALLKIYGKSRFKKEIYILT